MLNKRQAVLKLCNIDGSVLIFILPEAYEKEMDQLMAAYALVNDEPPRREVSLKR